MQKCITLAEALRAWLGARSVRQGAQALGVAQNTLHGWLDGKAPSRLARLALASALGCSVEEVDALASGENGSGATGAA